MKNWIKNNNRKKPAGFSTDLETNIYVLVILLGFVLMFNTGCSTPIKDTYDNEPDMEQFQNHYEYCKQFEYDGETWMECITNPDIRTRLVLTPTIEFHTTVNGNTSTSTST